MERDLGEKSREVELFFLYKIIAKKKYLGGGRGGDRQKRGVNLPVSGKIHIILRFTFLSLEIENFVERKKIQKKVGVEEGGRRGGWQMPAGRVIRKD